MATVNCLISNILQNISFNVAQVFKLHKIYDLKLTLKSFLIILMQFSDASGTFPKLLLIKSYNWSSKMHFLKIF